MNTEPRESLLPYVGATDPSTLSDMLLVIAKNVEQSLLAAGAKPDMDYDIMDLFNLATPFALHVFQSQKIFFTSSNF